jgi:hypothetical protein
MKISKILKWVINPPARRQQHLLILSAIIMIILFVDGVFIRTNDYMVHLSFGEVFIKGDISSESFHDDLLKGSMYPIFRTMLDGIISIPNYYFTRAFIFIGSVVALIYSINVWQRLAAIRYPLPQQQVFASITLSLLAVAPFLTRDFNEAGLQIYLLFMLTLAAQTWKSGARITSGFWLALAVSYKATPLLFLPFLIWKREWRTASAMAVWLVVLSLTPAIWLGWNGMIEGHVSWIERLEKSHDHVEAYPSLGIIEQPTQNNLGLRALVARYVESHPEGHPLFIDHPLFFQFGNIESPSAKITVWVILFLMATFVAIRFRHRWNTSQMGADMAPEWSVAILACALLSPITWKQHLVVALPCILLAVSSTIACTPPKRSRVLILALVFAVLIILRRYLFGPELSNVFHSYKFDTIALIVFALLVIFPPIPISAAQRDQKKNQLNSKH